MGQYVFARNGMGNYTTGTGMREDMLMQPFNIFNYQAGVVGANDLIVSENASPDMSVNIAAGRCFVQNSSYTVNTANSTKFWGVLNDDIENVLIDTNVSGSTRIDIIVVKINTIASPDDYASNVATIEVVKGAPGAGAPATPNNSLKIAQIQLVTGTTTQITNSMITDSRAACGQQDSLGLVAHVPNLTNKYIEVYSNQIFPADSSTESFVLTKIIVPSGLVNAGNLPNALTTANTATMCDIELLPGDHYLSEKLNISGVRYVSIYGHGYGTRIMPISTGFADNETIQIFNSVSISIKNLSVGVSTASGASRAILVNNGGGVDDIEVDVWIEDGDSGDTGLVTTGTTLANRWDITLRLVEASPIAAFNINYLKGGFIKTIASSAAWTLGANTSYNVVHVTTDTAGTDSGTGNQVTQATY